MSHDKIRAAARKRMAETGESYATARREVIKNYQRAGAGASSSSARWFAIGLQRYGPGLPMDWTHCWAGARGNGGVEVDSDRAAGADAGISTGHPSRLSAIGRPL